MEQQRTPGWRQFGLTGWFSVILGVRAWWARHPRHTVDLSTRWDVGRLDLRAVLFGLVLAYLLMWAVYLVGQLILPTDHRQLLRQGLWGRPARWTRGVIVVAALFLGGLNTYTQVYHPLHYAQKTVARHRLDRLGLGMAYSVKTIEVN